MGRTEGASCLGSWRTPSLRRTGTCSAEIPGASWLVCAGKRRPGGSFRCLGALTHAGGSSRVLPSEQHAPSASRPHTGRRDRPEPCRALANVTLRPAQGVGGGARGRWGPPPRAPRPALPAGRSPSPSSAGSAAAASPPPAERQRLRPAQPSARAPSAARLAPQRFVPGVLRLPTPLPGPWEPACCALRRRKASAAAAGRRSLAP